MLFSCVATGIRKRFIDVSHQAIGSLHFPISVGFRSQTQKLKFLSSEIEGRFLKPVITFKKVIEIFKDQFNSGLPNPICHQAHIGETFSLLYSPFYLEDKLFDAILNEPVPTELPDNFDISLFSGGRPKWDLHFIPTLCPSCGWDLEGSRDSIVLCCKNCSSVWRPIKKNLKKLTVAHLPSNDGNVTYMPFWRIKANISGINLRSYADLIKVANLPKVAQKGWDQVRFHFWCPAFKVRPQNFLQIAGSMTVSQFFKKLSPEMPEGKRHPVNLPVKEAVESLKLNLANFMRPREKMTETIENITITPESYLLTYIPFNEEHHELVQPDISLAINRNMLGLAKNL